MLPARQTGVAQRQRHGDEGGGQQQVQGEDAEIEPQQLTVEQHPAELGGDRLGVAVDPAHRGIGYLKAHHGHAEQGEQAGQPEDAGYPDPAVQHRSHDHRDGEGQADGDADEGHDLDAVFLAGQIGRQRHHRRRYRAAAL